MSRTMDEKEDSHRNNNNQTSSKKNLKDSSLSSTSLPSLSSNLSSSSTTPLSYNRSVDLHSSTIMGRKNFKPESVSCLVQRQPVSVNQLDNQSTEGLIKMRELHSSSTSSSSTVTTPMVKTSSYPPYHPHHYHHHRHYHHHHHQPHKLSSYQHKHGDDHIKQDESATLKDEENILHGSSSSPTPSSSSSSTIKDRSCSVYSISRDNSVSMRRSDNTNPLGLPDWNQQQSSSNININLIKSSNPVGDPSSSSCKVHDDQKPSSSPTPGSSSYHSKVTDPITSHHHHHPPKYHHNHRTHLHSPRKSKRILSCASSSRCLHRSSSDPGMASSATYSTHTSALLLTTGAYSGSPSLLASSSTSPSPTPTPTPPPSSSVIRNRSCSPFYIPPPTTTQATTKVISTTPSSTPSPTPPRYFVPSSSSLPHRTRHLTGSPGPPTSTTNRNQFTAFCVNPSPSSSPPPPPKPAPSQFTSSTSTSGASSASQFFSTQMSNTKRCVLRLDGYSYLIVANPPETKVTKDAIESNRPTETIVARRGIQKATVQSSISPSSWNAKDQDSSTDINKPGTDTLSILKESTMETLPPVDTVEACDKAASRLRELAQHLDHGEVPISILKKTLQYAACVLDTVTMDETRKILDEEDDLSEVQPDAVPNEVREWLASTFTRNNTAQKRRSEEKPKFRSVANAIRAGIMVDRLYRRLCCSNMVQIPPKIADRLKSIDSWSYDCFKLNEASNNQVLKYISYELLNRYGLVHKFKIPLETLESCLNQFEQGYTKFKNPYHNNIHAADVTQTVHYMLSKMGLVNWLTDLEIFATLLAAIIHDFQHTGTTNNFHVMSESETALLYNDRAVLENFHVSAAFRILKENDCNILIHLNKEEYRELRTLVIDMVLATDMSSHFQQIKTMKSLLSNANEFTVDKSKALSLVLHCCDISHPSKQWDIHRRWTELLLEEFFRQGDKERELGLPYSPLCDRNTTLVAESQIGFIDFIVAPSMEVCGDLLDKIYQQLEGCRHSSGSSEESLEERLPDNGSRPKSLSTYKNKRGGLSIDSAESPINSRPVASAPASPRFSHCSSFGNCKAEGGRLKRPWADNLEENRKRWQERAAIDAIQREQNARKQTTDGISLSMSPESEL